MAIVTILIPAFNAAATLNATLASVARQSWTDWEAIVLDDGSTDATAAVATRWTEKDSRVLLVRSSNHGLAAARNLAARHARAQWLVFLDADDLIEANYLEVMQAAAVRSAVVDVVFCSGARIAADGRTGEPEVTPQGGYFERLTRTNPFFVHACLVRRSAFERHDGFDISLRTCEDWDLWQRLARGGAVFLGLTDCLALYRLRSDSLSHDLHALFPAGRKVIERGHAPDIRVRDPLPEFANGQPADECPQAVVAFAFWCANALVGCGGNGNAFLRQLDLPAGARLEADRCAGIIHDAVPRGACALVEDWPALWPKYSLEIRETLEALAARLGQADLADRSFELLKSMISR